MSTVFQYLSFLFVILVLFSCQKSHKPQPDFDIPPKYVTTEPSFTKHGELSFLSSEKKEITAIDIEIAETEATREKGLMFRKHMKPNQGMLFIFPDESRRTFWMKDTDLPLDLVFVNAEKMIIHIAPNCVPYSTESIPSFEYAQYVVEVNAGYCKQNQIVVGGFIEYIRN